MTTDLDQPDARRRTHRRSGVMTSPHPAVRRPRRRRRIARRRDPDARAPQNLCARVRDRGRGHCRGAVLVPVVSPPAEAPRRRRRSCPVEGCVDRGDRPDRAARPVVRDHDHRLHLMAPPASTRSRRRRPVVVAGGPEWRTEYVAVDGRAVGVVETSGDTARLIAGAGDRPQRTTDAWTSNLAPRDIRAPGRCRARRSRGPSAATSTLGRWQ